MTHGNIDSLILAAVADGRTYNVANIAGAVAASRGGVPYADVSVRLALSSLTKKGTLLRVCQGNYRMATASDAVKSVDLPTFVGDALAEIWPGGHTVKSLRDRATDKLGRAFSSKEIRAAIAEATAAGRAEIMCYAEAPIYYSGSRNPKEAARLNAAVVQNTPSERDADHTCRQTATGLNEQSIFD